MYDAEKGCAKVWCTDCHEPYEVKMTEAQYHRILIGDGCIQNIIPEVSPDLRELFVSGMCGKCWDKLFEGMDEEGDEDE